MTSSAEPETPAEPESDFYRRVWGIVAEIPCGCVTTYGHIAESLGARRSARMVGWALNASSAMPIPCHRVVNRFGGLSGSIHFGGPYVMQDLLCSEGISFDEHGCVLMAEHLWIPPGAEEEKSMEDVSI